MGIWDWLKTDMDEKQKNVPDILGDIVRADNKHKDMQIAATEIKEQESLLRIPKINPVEKVMKFKQHKLYVDAANNVYIFMNTYESIRVSSLSIATFDDPDSPIIDVVVNDDEVIEGTGDDATYSIKVPIHLQTLREMTIGEIREFASNQANYDKMGTVRNFIQYTDYIKKHRTDYGNTESLRVSINERFMYVYEYDSRIRSLGREYRIRNLQYMIDLTTNEIISDHTDVLWEYEFDQFINNIPLIYRDAGNKYDKNYDIALRKFNLKCLQDKHDCYIKCIDELLSFHSTVNHILEISNMRLIPVIDNSEKLLMFMGAVDNYRTIVEYNFAHQKVDQNDCEFRLFTMQYFEDLKEEK